MALTGPVALVYRALGLGDLLTAVPALRAIRAALPDHRVVLATSSWLAPLLPLVDAVDEWRPAEPLTPLAWPGQPPTVAINLHGSGPQSHRVLMALRPGRLIAFAREDLGVAGPPWLDGEHEVDRWRRLVGSELAVDADAENLFLPQPTVAAPVDRAIVVHPGAADPARRWPAERFAEVARHLAASGRPVVVTGSAAEAELTEAVARAAGLPASAILAGTPLAGLAALVARAELVVSNDTGVAHLATSFRTPSVVLFGPVSPAHWGPPPDGPHVVLWHGTTGGSGADLLARIQVEEVTAAAERLLSAHAA